MIKLLYKREQISITIAKKTFTVKFLLANLAAVVWSCHAALENSRFAGRDETTVS